MTDPTPPTRTMNFKMDFAAGTSNNGSVAVYAVNANDKGGFTYNPLWSGPEEHAPQWVKDAMGKKEPKP